MDQRFPHEFITWHHKTPVGIKVNEVFGMDSKSGKVWIELARQIYSEQGEHFYREIDHYENGAPFLVGYSGRISITHTSHFLAVASLPKTPEVDLSVFNPRSAMGIDAEPVDRSQVLKVRNRFLSEEDEIIVDKDDLFINVLAWTAKEALYKAAMTPGLDFRNSLQIKSLPVPQEESDFNKQPVLGKADIIFPPQSAISIQEMYLYSYISYGCVVTIAFSPKCAKFG